MEYESFFRQLAGDVEGMSDELVSALAQNATARTLEKGEHLLERGEVPSKVGFLASGVVRCYTVDINGHDVTDCIIAQPGSVLAPSADLAAPVPSAVEALLESEVVLIDVALIRSLLETSLEANHLYIRLLTEAWRAHWEMRRVVSQLRARDRYLWFLERFPGVVDKIPVKYVGSLLGMTPVTLSRVRTELREEGVPVC